MLKHTGPISGVACTNKLVATAGYDNRVILWCGDTKKSIAVGYHDHLANQCEFSHCGKYLVTASSDHTARLWRLPDMKLLAVLSEHNDDVESVAIHRTKNLIATASRDNKVRVFNFNGQLLTVLEGHQADVISVQWGVDLKTLLSSSDDGTVRVWDIESGTQINQLNDSGIQTDAMAMTDGTTFAGDDAGQIHLISASRKIMIKAHQAGIKKLVYAEQFNKLLSVAYDRKACIWNMTSKEKLELDSQFDLPPIIWPRSCSFYDDTKIIFATFGDSFAMYDFKVNQWELDHIHATHGLNAILATGSDIYTIGDAGVLMCNNTEIQRLPSLCNFIASCDQVIITGGQTGEVFNAISGEMIYRHRSPLNCATQFEHAGDLYLVIGTYTGEAIVLMKTQKGMVYVKTISLHNNAIKGLAASHHLLFSVCATGSAAWYDLQNNQILNVINHAHTKIANGCVALEANTFASISRDLRLRIWNNGVLAAKIQTPFTHSIKCIAVDSSFRYLAMGSYNGVVAIYDRETSFWVTEKMSAAGISSICFDSQQNMFIAASYDGNIYRIK